MTAPLQRRHASHDERRGDQDDGADEAGHRDDDRPLAARGPGLAARGERPPVQRVGDPGQGHRPQHDGHREGDDADEREMSAEGDGSHAAPSVMMSFSCCQNEPGPPSGRNGEATGCVEELLGPEALDRAPITRPNSRVSSSMGMPTRGDERPDARAQPGDHHREPDDAEGQAESRWTSVTFHVRASISGWIAVTDHASGSGDGRDGSGRRRGTPALPAADVAGPGGGGGGRVCMGGHRPAETVSCSSTPTGCGGGRGEPGGSPVVARSGRAVAGSAFDGETGHEPVEPAGQPPVGPAEQLHGGGHEHHPHEGGVDQHGDRQTQADELDGAVRRRPRSCRTRTP